MSGRFISSLALFLAIGGAAEAQMAGADVQRAFNGKRIALSCADGTTANGSYRMIGCQGSISGTYRRAGMAAMKDSGTVRAAGDRLCLQFKMLNGGAENCFGVSQTSARTYSLSLSGVSACNVAIR